MTGDFKHSKACHIRILHTKVIRAQITLVDGPKPSEELDAKVVDLLKRICTYSARFQGVSSGWDSGFIMLYLRVGLH